MSKCMCAGVISLQEVKILLCCLTVRDYYGIRVGGQGYNSEMIIAVAVL